ncbi:MAG: hypothetical protein HC849_10600 [Oscillatoriales cyanobacterium RU_3_3]|nr:hypothetical protein [Microcoleus sp. SU_5_6]NJM60539.1 hypothetical protein [Oscillatoriales cyanobacterium RU_3_3]NJR25215.1 hypothetical protein [Richelia sp. CSU_2_1]
MFAANDRQQPAFPFPEEAKKRSHHRRQILIFICSALPADSSISASRLPGIEVCHQQDLISCPVDRP